MIQSIKRIKGKYKMTKWFKSYYHFIIWGRLMSHVPHGSWRAAGGGTNRRGGETFESGIGNHFIEGNPCWAKKHFLKLPKTPWTTTAPPDSRFLFPTPGVRDLGSRINICKVSEGIFIDFQRFFVGAPISLGTPQSHMGGGAEILLLLAFYWEHQRRWPEHPWPPEIKKKNSERFCICQYPHLSVTFFAPIWDWQPFYWRQPLLGQKALLK